MNDHDHDRRRLFDTSIVELRRATSIANRELTRGRINEARRALGTIEQINHVLESVGVPPAPTHPHTGPVDRDRQPSNVIPLHHRADHTQGYRKNRRRLRDDDGIIPRIIDGLHRRRTDDRRVHDLDVPSVAECLEGWALWQV